MRLPSLPLATLVLLLGISTATAAEKPLSLTTNLAPRRPTLPGVKPGQSSHPIDRLLAASPQKLAHGPIGVLDDRTFARRVWLDLVGLLPPPAEFDRFLADKAPDRRARLIDRLLTDRRGYAAHWLTFWNDCLRNAYRGTGFIDDGRRQITGWLYRSLYDNKPYDRFVHELVSPIEGSGGFVRGLKWRGVVNASQRVEVQAAQHIAQVFLGTNLKCASCHNSFINNWKLNDAYGLAAVFATGPLVLHECNKPTGQTAKVRFLFPNLGEIDAKQPRPQRMKQLADILVQRANGRLTRTIVNRLWATLFGHGLVEPVDEMERLAWQPDVLDWLAEDLADHRFDLKHTLRTICTSRAYQRPSVPAPRLPQKDYRFAGPRVRRMSAEQFLDGVSRLAGVPLVATKQMNKRDGRGQGGQLPLIKAVPQPEGSKQQSLLIRASITMPDPLQRALGRPNREQVVTRRDSLATMLQALELTNGTTLDRLVAQGAGRWHKSSAGDVRGLLDGLFRQGLGRTPSDDEREVLESLCGTPPTPQGIQDVLWTIMMLPEFQLIH